MGITKTDGFTIEINQMAEALKALGHPARLAIMQYLAESPACICSDIVEELPLAQPTISRHLSELKKVGLIKGNIEGKNICYCINTEAFEVVRQFLNTISLQVEKNKGCC